MPTSPHVWDGRSSWRRWPLGVSSWRWASSGIPSSGPWCWSRPVGCSSRCSVTDSSASRRSMPGSPGGCSTSWRWRRSSPGCGVGPRWTGRPWSPRSSPLQPRGRRRRSRLRAGHQPPGSGRARLPRAGRAGRPLRRSSGSRHTRVNEVLHAGARRIRPGQRVAWRAGARSRVGVPRSPGSELVASVRASATGNHHASTTTTRTSRIEVDMPPR